MHSSGPLIAMLATKFNCFPLYLPRRGNKSIRWRKKSEFSCCTNTIFWQLRNTMRKVARLPKQKHHLRLSHVPIHANPHQFVTLTKMKVMSNCKSRIRRSWWTPIIKMMPLIIIIMILTNLIIVKVRWTRLQMGGSSICRRYVDILIVDQIPLQIHRKKTRSSKDEW